MSDNSKIDIAPGDTIAGYRLETQLGAGGMAVVFRAHDERLDRRVALKILPPALALDTDFRTRFIRESRAAATVDHPNIIPIYDAGENNNLLYIAMRYVAGGDLKSLLATPGPVPPKRAAVIIAQAADALDSANSHGLIHRDVKPANILLDPVDISSDLPIHSYLCDFGISKQTLASHLTSTGQFVGTLDYIAPEQIDGRMADGRADQYSLACTAFEALTGQAPYKREYAIALINAHLSQPPPKVTDFRPELPSAVNAVIARAMAKSPADRFANCLEFATSLQAALEGQQLPVATAPVTSPHPGTVIHPLPVEVRNAPTQIAAGPLPPYGVSPVPPYDVSSIPPLPVVFADDGNLMARLASIRSLSLPLKTTFRYVHESTGVNHGMLPSLGNDSLVHELENRIKHSRGGSFLITGFRGVGKSTLVDRLLGALAKSPDGRELLVPVSLSVARTTTTERLLFAIVRRVFESILDIGAFDQLPFSTRRSLLLAYMRTSMSFNETRTETREKNMSLSLGLGPAKPLSRILHFIAPSLSLSHDRSTSLATEASFLAYSETDAEYDLMRIITLVAQESDRAATGRRSGWWRIGRRSRPLRLKLVVILDEIDKLTTSDAGLTAVEDLLTGIKNVLTIPGAHFLLVAGVDLHDRAVRDSSRGNGLYESVFSGSMYVPCSWDAPDVLVQDMIPNVVGSDSETVHQLVNYLRFKSRGVPRRLLQEFYQFVTWRIDGPHLAIDAKGLSLIDFYAYLEEVLSSYFEHRTRDRFFSVNIDEDRWRLGGYYVVDWVLSSDGRPFSATEILQHDDPNFDSVLRISQRGVDRLLDHLRQHGILELIREISPNATQYADVPESQARVFRLTDDVRRKQVLLAVRYESERAAHGRSALTRSMGSPATAVVLGGRYELIESLGQGAITEVHRGRDLVAGRNVAVKLLRGSLIDDPVAVARSLREADIASKVAHPNVVQTYDVLAGVGSSRVLVMELLTGRNLQDAIGVGDTMQPRDVAVTGVALADALEYLEREKVIRLGLKPKNIVLTERGPVISDLGVATLLGGDRSITQAGHLVGTPAYMAPELLDGKRVDARADQFALGLVLGYCLTGANPSQRMAVTSPSYVSVDLSGLNISTEFQRALTRSLYADPDDRYPSAAEFAEALKATPEWLSNFDSGAAPRTTTRRR